MLGWLTAGSTPYAHTAGHDTHVFPSFLCTHPAVAPMSPHVVDACTRTVLQAQHKSRMQALDSSVSAVQQHARHRVEVYPRDKEGPDDEEEARSGVQWDDVTGGVAILFTTRT